MCVSREKREKEKSNIYIEHNKPKHQVSLSLPCFALPSIEFLTNSHVFRDEGRRFIHKRWFSFKSNRINVENCQLRQTFIHPTRKLYHKHVCSSSIEKDLRSFKITVKK